MTLQTIPITPIIVLIIQGLLAWALWSIRRAFVREEDYAEHLDNVTHWQHEYNSRVSKLEGNLEGLEDRLNLLPDAATIAHLASIVESLRGDLKAVDVRITGLDRLIQRIEHALDRQECALRGNK